MVHALKSAHRILRPEGLLINVHDLPIPHVVEVHSAGAEIKAGWMTDREDFRDERAALNALARVVSDGYFWLEDEQDFGFNVHVDDLPELQHWLAEDWSSAILPDKTCQRIEEIYGRVGQDAEVVLSVPTRMTMLKAT